MKAIIFDIRSFSVHDGPGIRTTFFFKGCPLRCAWCHNPESHDSHIQQLAGSYKLGKALVPCVETIGETLTLEQALNRAEADRLFFEDSGGGITLSGGEPLLQNEFVLALLDAAQKRDIHTAVDTSGYAVGSVFKQVIAKTRLVLFDLKIIDEAMHLKYTGQSNRLIAENFAWLLQQKKEVIIRIPLVEEITDTIQNLEAIRAMLKSNNNIQRIDLLPYHQSAFNKYRRLGLKYPLNHLKNYPVDKQQQIKTYFNDLAPVVSIGA